MGAVWLSCNNVSQSYLVGQGYAARRARVQLTKTINKSIEIIKIHKKSLTTVLCVCNSQKKSYNGFVRH
jgi:hypothetical protein